MLNREEGLISNHITISVRIRCESRNKKDFLTFSAVKLSYPAKIIPVVHRKCAISEKIRAGGSLGSATAYIKKLNFSSSEGLKERGGVLNRVFTVV